MLLSLLWQQASAAAPAWPKEERVPGGVALLQIAAGGVRPEAVHFSGMPVRVVAHDGQWWAVLGLGLDMKPGSYALQAAGHAIPFKVQDKHYLRQDITLKNDRKVNPYAADMPRILREKKHLLKVVRVFSHPQERLSIFQLPVLGQLTGLFGKRRYFNGQPRKPHGGIDIAAAAGTEVRAPAAATVIDTGNYFFNGNAVFLDHGQGLISVYIHLHDIAVQPGDQISAGGLLGHIGQTGRATGPHLHWGVKLNGVYVNPMLWLRDADRAALLHGLSS